jgi:H+-transporting ATPase
MGVIDLIFCVGCFAAGRYWLKLDTVTLRTLTVVTLVFSGQAVFYVARERRHLWSSPPGRWLIVSSAVDLSIVCILAANGILMAPLAVIIIASVFAAAIALAFVLDAVKLVLFRRLQIA